MFTEAVADYLRRTLGFGYLIIAYALMGAVALGLCLLLAFWSKRRLSRRAGLLGGFSLAILSSLSWIVVPYCGGYPNLASAFIGAIVFGAGTWGQEIAVHATNLILWPVLGWLMSTDSSRVPKHANG